MGLTSTGLPIMQRRREVLIWKWAIHHFCLFFEMKLNSSVNCHCQAFHEQSQRSQFTPQPRSSPCDNCRPAHLCTCQASPVALALPVWWGQICCHVQGSPHRNGWFHITLSTMLDVFPSTLGTWYLWNKPTQRCSMNFNWDSLWSTTLREFSGMAID